MPTDEGSEYETILGYCSQLNHQNPNGPLLSWISLARYPKARTERGHILNVVEKMSKMLRIISLPDNYDATLVARKFIVHVYRNHGLPNKIISDRGSIFMSGFRKTLYKILQVKISPSTAYRPQTHEQTEIVNRNLEEMIQSFVSFDNDNWDDHLVEFEVSYNASVHSTTARTPFFLSYRIDPRRVPVELMFPQKHPSIQEILSNIAKSSKDAHANIAMRK